MPKLQSMDVTIRGVTRSYVFDPAEPVDSSDEGEASLQLVGEAETTEVQMGAEGIYSASVQVSYTVRIDGYVTVELDDLDGIEDADTLNDYVRDGNYSAVEDAIQMDIEYQLNESTEVTDSEVQEAYDENGDAVEAY